LISWWVEAEIAAAVYAKVGRGLLVPAQGQISWRRLGLSSPNPSLVFPSSTAISLPRATSRRSNGLRAGDALHLAIADAQGMARAAERLGLPVSLV